MKKISMVLFLAAGAALDGQVVVTDTVHYFANKYYFKTATPVANFPEYSAPAATYTLVTYVGNVFENEEPLDILGIQTCIIRLTGGSTAFNQPVPVSLYLCNVNSGTGLPILPPIDSVNIPLMITSTSTPMRQQGSLTQVHRMNGKYALMFRNMSTRSGDVIYLKRTAGMTMTSTASPAQKMSDGYGVITYSGQCYKTTNFTAPGFGPGTDYEFVLAPIVQYTLQASQVKPADTVLCTHQQVSYLNTSSSRISSRFYNFIEFRRAWDKNPAFHPNAIPSYSLPTDIGGTVWHFLPEDGKIYNLAPGSNILTFQTDSAHKKVSEPDEDSTTCFQGNKFRVNLYSMRLAGGPHLFNSDEQFLLCTSFCGKDGVGLSEHPTKNIRIFPQPATGKVTLHGVPAGAELSLFNSAGQLTWSGYNEYSGELDLAGMAPGLYLLSIGLPDGQLTLRVMKTE